MGKLKLLLIYSETKRRFNSLKYKESAKKGERITANQLLNDLIDNYENRENCWEKNN